MKKSENSRHPDLSALRIDPQARAGHSTRRRTLLFLAVLVLIFASLGTWFILKSQKASVEIATARAPSEGRTSALLNASGYVTPRRRSTVAAKITGRIVEMSVEEGESVKAGQVLARLDDAEAVARLALVRAELKTALAAIPELEVTLADAERTYNRIRKLEKSASISVQDLDRATAAADGARARLKLARERVHTAEASIEVARQDLENCTIRAPFSGIAVSKDAQIGEIVSPISAGGGFTRTGIATIVDMNSLEIEVDVNESYISKVVPGQKVEATLDAYPNWKIPAGVRTIIPTADRQKATVKVRISFQTLDPKILPDMGVKVAFLSEEQPAPMDEVRSLIPKEAVRESDGSPVVFTFRDNRVRKCAVKIGRFRGDNVEVLAGISEGDQVVVGGPKDLRDGQRAEVKKKE
jgi:HlyD family secretion protein